MSEMEVGIINLRCGDQSVAFFVDFLSGGDDALSVDVLFDFLFEAAALVLDLLA